MKGVFWLRWVTRGAARHAPQIPNSALAPSAPIHDATPTDVGMMRRALRLAGEAAALREVPVGAVVYRTATGEVLGEGFNRRESDADPSAHAEMIAIRAAAARLGDWRLNDCTIAVTLEPCAMCAGLIVNARVGRLIYGARDPKAGAVASLYALTTDARQNHRVDPIGGVLEAECGNVLRAFFRDLRRARRTGLER